jgi:acyl-homoserine-lactone acylase
MRYLSRRLLGYLAFSMLLAGHGFALEARIERDQWGVPHIHGATDADAAFGLAYAQAEDTWPIIQNSIPYYRGTAGRYFGTEAAKTDYLVGALGFWSTLTEKYGTLDPASRDYLQAFAAGLNHYADRHPEAVTLDVLPITSQDLIAAHMLRHLLFYGFEGVVSELLGAERAHAISPPPLGSPTTSDPTGSNASAVSPRRTEDGSTLLMINSHQPLTGPVAWYEAHIASDEGLDIQGGLFPGSPTIGVGFTAFHGWGATVNKPDLVDVYLLQTDPDDDNRYWFEGEWLVLDRTEIEIDVLLWDIIPWSVTREIYRSVHGPVFKTDHGTYAIRYAGMNEIAQIEQWLAMNKAQNFAEWRSAIALNTISSFNFVYANADGDIYFIHNSQMPKRTEGWQWQDYLPGDREDVIWNEYLPVEQLPQVLNPASGFILSANQNPFAISAPGSNPPSNATTEASGYQTRMTNRAVRGLELFSRYDQVSWEEFWQLKHDHQYSAQYRGVDYLNTVIRMNALSSDEAEAQQILADWNLDTNIENRSAALGVCVLSAEWRAEQTATDAPDPHQTLSDCIELVRSMSGRLDPSWGEVNRHGRGTQSWPAAGGPDTLRAIYSRRLEKDDRHMTVTAGDGLYYLIRWSPDGTQSVQGVHQYGSNMVDPSSPHYLDQAAHFAREETHSALFNAAEREATITRRYEVRQTQ